MLEDSDKPPALKKLETILKGEKEYQTLTEASVIDIYRSLKQAAQDTQARKAGVSKKQVAHEVGNLIHDACVDFLEYDLKNREDPWEIVLTKGVRARLVDELHNMGVEEGLNAEKRSSEMKKLFPDYYDRGLDRIMMGIRKRLKREFPSHMDRYSIAAYRNWVHKKAAEVINPALMSFMKEDFADYNAFERSISFNETKYMRLDSDFELLDIQLGVFENRFYLIKKLAEGISINTEDTEGIACLEKDFERARKNMNLYKVIMNAEELLKGTIKSMNENLDKVLESIDGALDQVALMEFDKGLIEFNAQVNGYNKLGYFSGDSYSIASSTKAVLNVFSLFMQKRLEARIDMPKVTKKLDAFYKEFEDLEEGDTKALFSFMVDKAEEYGTLFQKFFDLNDNMRASYVIDKHVLPSVEGRLRKANVAVNKQVANLTNQYMPKHVALMERVLGSVDLDSFAIVLDNDYSSIDDMTKAISTLDYPTIIEVGNFLDALSTEVQGIYKTRADAISKYRKKIEQLKYKTIFPHYTEVLGEAKTRVSEGDTSVISEMQHVPGLLREFCEALHTPPDSLVGDFESLLTKVEVPTGSYDELAVYYGLLTVEYDGIVKDFFAIRDKKGTKDYKEISGFFASTAFLLQKKLPVDLSLPDNEEDMTHDQRCYIANKKEALQARQSIENFKSKFVNYAEEIKENRTNFIKKNQSKLAKNYRQGKPREAENICRRLETAYETKAAACDLLAIIKGNHQYAENSEAYRQEGSTLEQKRMSLERMYNHLCKEARPVAFKVNYNDLGKLEGKIKLDLDDYDANLHEEAVQEAFQNIVAGDVEEMSAIIQSIGPGKKLSDDQQRAITDFTDEYRTRPITRLVNCSRLFGPVSKLVDLILNYHVSYADLTDESQINYETVPYLRQLAMPIAQQFIAKYCRTKQKQKQ